MTQPTVETTPGGPATGGAASAPVETPAPVVPATTPQPDPVEEKVKAALAAREAEWKREAQSQSDRLVAKARAEEQARAREREKAIRDAMKTRAKQAGDEGIDQFDNFIDVSSQLAEYQAFKAQEAAKTESEKYARDIAEAFGVKWNDPRLKLDESPVSTWDEYRERCKKVVADDARAERETAKQRELEGQRAAANAALEGGNPATLASPMAGVPGPESELEKFDNPFRDAGDLYRRASKDLRSKPVRR